MNLFSFKTKKLVVHPLTEQLRKDLQEWFVIRNNKKYLDWAKPESDLIFPINSEFIKNPESAKYRAHFGKCFSKAIGRFGLDFTLQSVRKSATVWAQDGRPSPIDEFEKLGLQNLSQVPVRALRDAKGHEHEATTIKHYAGGIRVTREEMLNRFIANTSAINHIDQQLGLNGNGANLHQQPTHSDQRPTHKIEIPPEAYALEKPTGGIEPPTYALRVRCSTV